MKETGFRGAGGPRVFERVGGWSKKGTGRAMVMKHPPCRPLGPQDRGITPQNSLPPTGTQGTWAPGHLPPTPKGSPAVGMPHLVLRDPPPFREPT